VNATYATLQARLAQVSDLARVARLLFWDQQTMMPPGGSEIRAHHLATLHRTAHELFVADETGRLLDEVTEYEESLDPESDEASLIRVARRDYDKARRVPTELRAELAMAASHGLRAWAEAKEASDFGRFLPALERTLELKRRYIECFDGADEPYDILLDDYERGMKTAQVRAIFDRLKTEQIPLLAEIVRRNGDSGDGAVDGEFPIDAQRAFSRQVIEAFGLRPGTWRLDPTAHPFASGGGVDDIRLTTFYHDDNLESLFASMHEYGHGLYEHGVDPALERTPLGTGVSLGLHESQSRMWENLVGRSRPFWRFFYPRLQQAFPRLAGVDLETFYRAINRVQPSLIRIHADEVTYNLHIILRFELEQDMVKGDVELRELPEIWRQRMHEYLGVEVPDDAHGVLQDMHWGGGSIGYFSTYSLGNVMSLQIWERVVAEIPDLDEQFERGEFGALREWLRERLHRHGRKFTPAATLAKVVGGPIDPEPYLRYLKRKHLEELA
jgi:carboxypeptidase Taq